MVNPQYSKRGDPAGPNHSYVTVNSDVTLIVLSSTFVLTRLYVRKFISKSLGLDDGAALISLIFVVASAALELNAVTHGMGQQMGNVSSKDFEIFISILPFYSMCWFNAIFFTRLAVLLFIRRLLSILKSSTMIWVAVAALTTQHLVLFFAFLFQCSPVKGLWLLKIDRRHCVSPVTESRIIYAHAGIGICCDVALFVVPMVFMWRNLPTDHMRIRVMLLLGCGCFAWIAGVVRFSAIVTENLSENITYNIVYGAMWTQVECHTGLIVSCFPALNQIIRLTKQRITGTHPPDDYGARAGRPRTRTYLERKAEEETGSRDEMFYVGDGSDQDLEVVVVVEDGGIGRGGVATRMTGVHVEKNSREERRHEG